MWWIILAILSIPLLLAALLQLFQYWYRSKTQGDRYFSMLPPERRLFRATLKKNAVILLPIYRFMAKGIRQPRIATFSFHNIKAPAAIASTGTFQAAVNYKASGEDIFIATFMKSGTTWMQNIVFELLHHGSGDFSENGYRHLYALSPWIECSPNASVSMENAPLVSPYKKRLVKTHLPANLCPFNKSAKYIYVTRHPVNTFASCEHFFQMLTGPFCPDRQALLDLFCSNDMLWGSWPEHVSGWWQQSRQNPNCLFIRYEDMQNNFTGSLKAIAGFLDLTLSPEEFLNVAEKTSFTSMKVRADFFEMAPPNIFSVSSNLEFLGKGSAGRQTALDTSDTNRLMAFCRNGMKNNLSLAHLLYSGD